MTGRSRPIFVLGSGRSGTSVVTRIVNLLGAELCVPDDLYSESDNPAGHWESRTVISINEWLLELLDGSGEFPPRTSAGWTLRPEVKAMSPSAATSFFAVHPPNGWVCKDPRLSMTLPFWVQALQVDPIVVLVIRNPLEIVDSLERLGFPRGYAIAYWERYARSALAVCTGHSVVACRYDDLMSRPHEAVHGLAAMLAEAGAAVDPAMSTAAATAILQRGGSQKHVESIDPSFTGLQQQLADAYVAAPNWSARFDVQIPPESETTQLLISARRDQQSAALLQSKLEAQVASAMFEAAAARSAAARPAWRRIARYLTGR